MSKIGHEFMRQTAMETGESPQALGLPQPPLELPAPEGSALIPLPAPGTLEVPPLDLRKAIEGRRSVRSYAETPLSLEEFSFLLWCTQGVIKVSKRPATQRTVPSAGARHAFETYLLVNRVSGLQTGLYRFMAIEHALLPVDLSEGIGGRLQSACGEQEMITRGAAAFFWTAVEERMTWRYKQRGYRYLHLDAGHVCQNLYLAALAVDCGVCAIAAFSDEVLNQTIGLDGERQFAVYCASCGKRMPA